MSVPRLTGGRCQCAACGLYFTGTREFERHRLGAYAEIGRRNGSRRCMSLEELEAHNWRRTDRGFWMQPRAQRAPARAQGPCHAAPARVGGAP